MNILKLIRALTDIADGADDASKVEVMLRDSEELNIKTYSNTNLAERDIEILVTLEK
jgi:hypothetical protein